MTPPPPSKPMGPFLVLWTGQALSLVGSQAVQFAVIWWLTMETGSATVLATATFVGLVPQVALGPIIGALVDRWDRKPVMLLADLVVALASLALAHAFLTDWASPPVVLAALLIRAIGSTFHTPAMLASTSLMVPDKHLTRIQGLNQTLQGGLIIITAPLGAWLVALLPMEGVMLVDVGTALFAIVPLVFIHVPRPQSAAGAEAPGSASPVGQLWGEVVAGFRYLGSRGGHLMLLIMAALINMCLVPAFALMPLLVLEEMGGDAFRLGWMNSAFGIGVIAGGAILGAWGGFRRRILTSLSSLMTMGAAVAAVGLAPATPVNFAFAAMFMVGVTVAPANGPIMAIFQATIPPGLQGRVFTLMGSMGHAMAPIGLLFAAPVANLVGVRAWYLFGGALCLSMGALSFFIPAILDIESPGAAGAATAAVDPP